MAVWLSVLAYIQIHRHPMEKEVFIPGQFLRNESIIPRGTFRGNIEEPLLSPGSGSQLLSPLAEAGVGPSVPRIDDGVPLIPGHQSDDEGGSSVPCHPLTDGPLGYAHFAELVKVQPQQIPKTDLTSWCLDFHELSPDLGRAGFVARQLDVWHRQNP